MAKTKPTDIDRVALQWLLVGGVAAAAPLALELPMWISVAFLGTVIWRYAIERFHVYRPGRLVRYALLALLLVSVYREFGTVLGRDPGLSLLVALLGLKLLELRTQRDAMFTLFLFYVVLIGGFLFGQTLPGALWAIGAIAITLVALIRLQQAMTTRAAFGLAGELLLKAIPLLLVLYVLFPRVGGTLWGLPADAHGGLTGLPDEVRPGTIKSLSESTSVAFRVDFIGDRPPARDLYWRALILWSTDGKTWRRDTPRVDVGRVRAVGAPTQYRITLEPSNKPWLMALDLPVTTPQDARMRPGFVISNDEPITERKSYSLISYTRYTTDEISQTERNAALALPPLSPRVRAFADSLRMPGRSPLAVAQAMLDYIRHENFVYTLTPPPLDDDPVDQFLFETRRGFCEHYATTFTTLMRAAGVPSRVVIGYQGGELNPNGNYLIVRQLDAHAWSEIWVAGRGWVRVDPTAAIAPERVELGIEAIRRLEAQGLTPGAVGSDLLARAMEVAWLEKSFRQLRLYWDYTNMAWYRWVVDYREDRQRNFLQALGFQTIEWSRILTVIGGACGLILLIYVMWSRRGPRLDPAQRLYERFCRKLARVGLKRAPHEGALTFAERASSARPDLGPAIQAITETYLNLRYGTRASNEELRELAKQVAELKSRRR